jgi:hypothetical protein
LIDLKLSEAKMAERIREALKAWKISLGTRDVSID